MRKMFYVFLITLIVGVFFSFGAGTVSAQSEYIEHEIELKNSNFEYNTTKLSDTYDYTIVSTITSSSSVTDTLKVAVEVYTIPENGEGGWSPTADKTSVEIDPGGTEDVTLTVPREFFLAVGEYEVVIQADSLTDTTVGAEISIYFTVTADPGQPTVLPKPGPPPAYYEVAIKGNIAQIPGISYTHLGWYVKTPVTEDVTKTLSVTNNGNRADLISLTVSSNLNGVILTQTEITLDPGASGNVTLTIPRTSLLVPAIYEITVKGTSRGDPSRISKLFVLTYVHGQGFITTLKRASIIPDLHFESLDDLVWPTNPTEDLTLTLRLTNIGSNEDVISVHVTGDIRTATVNPNSVILQSDISEDIILTIPRLALSNAGTYNVTVTVTSGHDPNIKRSVTTTLTVKDDTSTPTNPINPTEPTQPDLSTHKVIFSEFMFEVGGGETALPRWFEVYNNSNATVNLRGWKLQWKSSLPSLEETATFNVDFPIPSQQSRLIVTALGRYSGGNLSDNSVNQFSGILGVIISYFPFKISSLNAFSLKLINPDDEVVDQIGTLSGDKKTWDLPESLIEGARSSLIRRFDENGPRSGLLRRGWIPAYKAKHLVAGIYYGSPRDLSTPGYRHGKPLPVELSQFSAKFVKDEVVINWTTESELNNAGFNIYRSTSQTKDFHRINTKLIKGAGTTGERNTYQFIDKNAKPNVVYYYRIEDVDLSGTPRIILTTYQLRGVIAPADKHITTWGTLKDNR